MTIIKYIAIMLVGYFMGSSSMSYYISKIKKINIKEQGSKNYGASNTLVLAGKRAGLAVLVHDIMKSFLAILLIRFLLNIPYNRVEWILAAVGLCAVMGHIFPFYLKFNGGKGFAPYLGVVLGLDWRLFLGIVVLIFVVAFVTDYIVAATFSTITVAPLYFLFVPKALWVMVLVLACSLLLLYKHKENIVNLKEGKEMRIRSAFANKYRKNISEQ